MDSVSIDNLHVSETKSYLIDNVSLTWIIANATEEFLVRQRPLYEVVGQLGMWGFLINGIQTAALEGKKMPDVPWSGDISTWLHNSSSVGANFDAQLDC